MQKRYLFLLFACINLNTFAAEKPNCYKTCTSSLGGKILSSDQKVQGQIDTCFSQCMLGEEKNFACAVFGQWRNVPASRKQKLLNLWLAGESGKKMYQTCPNRINNGKLLAKDKEKNGGDLAMRGGDFYSECLARNSNPILPTCSQEEAGLQAVDFSYSIWKTEVEGEKDVYAAQGKKG